MLLPKHQVLVATPDNANAVCLKEYNAHNEHEHHDDQFLGRQLQQLLAPWQAMRFINDAMDSLQIAYVSKSGQSVYIGKGIRETYYTDKWYTINSRSYSKVEQLQTEEGQQMRRFAFNGSINHHQGDSYHAGAYQPAHIKVLCK